VADQVRQFQVTLLRPLYVLLLVSTIVALFNGRWWWLACCVVGAYYLGVIGSKLHPLKSAVELSQGPLEGAAARVESVVLPAEVKQLLVGLVCTRVGIFLGVVGGAASWAYLGIRWYFAIVVAWIIMLLAGALLKVTFRANYA